MTEWSISSQSLHSYLTKIPTLLNWSINHRLKLQRKRNKTIPLSNTYLLWLQDLLCPMCHSQWRKSIANSTSFTVKFLLWSTVYVIIIILKWKIVLQIVDFVLGCLDLVMHNVTKGEKCLTHGWRNCWRTRCSWRIWISLQQCASFWNWIANYSIRSVSMVSLFLYCCNIRYQMLLKASRCFLFYFIFLSPIGNSVYLLKLAL